jgi:hypothetical protein
VICGSMTSGSAPQSRRYQRFFGSAPLRSQNDRLFFDRFAEALGLSRMLLLRDAPILLSPLAGAGGNWWNGFRWLTPRAKAV